MLKLYRNILAGGLLAAGLAACGDKVTVTNPPPAPAVSSVTVTPASVPLSIGQSVTLSASVVVADSATSTAVSWVSSNTAVATVSAAGVVTAVSTGTTTVIATSTADVHVSGAAVVTVSAAPPGVVSFSVTPPTVILSPGQTVQATANTVVQTGVTPPAVSWVSLNSTVATVGAATGLITAVSPGTAVINASITTGGQTATASIQVTVSVASAASISIFQVLSNATATQVNLSNVAGEMDVQLNFNPGNQQVDSLGVFVLPAPNSTVPVGAKAANTQRFATNPAAGVITIPIPTQEFGKNPSNATDTVYYTNGQRTLFARIWVKNPAGGADVAIDANNFIPFNLNNVDGWAADITKPTVSATNLVSGLTFWGGPTANTTAIIYPVIYTQGRSISATTGTTWTVGLALGTTLNNFVGCPATTTVFGAPAIALAGSTGQINQGTSKTFGYTANGAAVSCTAYENTTGVGGVRDNIQISASIDNANNTYPLVLGPIVPVTAGNFVAGATTLIPNTVWFGSTPDSLRIDYHAPTLSVPSVARTSPAVTGWVNASFSLWNWSASDLGVGLKGTTLASRIAAGAIASTYSAVQCAGGAASNPMPTGTGADIPECAANAIGGVLTANIGSTVVAGQAQYPGYVKGNAPYQVTGTETDRLNNIGTSNASATFGVDKTAPTIRWGLGGDPTYTVAAIDQAGGLPDTIFAASKPLGTNTGNTAQAFRAEYIDLLPVPSGFIGVAAEVEALTLSNHTNPIGICPIPGIATAPGSTPAAGLGPNFVTNPNCTMTVNATAGVLRTDGWQAGHSLAVPSGEGYYYYKAQVTDAAGNPSAIVNRRLLVNVNNPFSTGLGVPAIETHLVMAFSATFADSAEVTASSMQLAYPNVPTTDSLRYPQVPLPLSPAPATCTALPIPTVAAAFDDCITSPYAGGISPATGAPYVRGIELVTNGTFGNTNVPAVYSATVKPTKVLAWSWNPGLHFAASPEIPIPALNVETGTGIAAWNAGNPLVTVFHFRIDSSISTVNFFGSVAPLQAQAASNTDSPNAPFARVDFYRLDAGGTWWNYLGSTLQAAAIPSDQGTFRSWVYAIQNASLLPTWNGTAAGAIAIGDHIIAVGVLPNGDALTTKNTVMVP